MNLMSMYTDSGIIAAVILVAWITETLSAFSRLSVSDIVTDLHLM